MEQILSEKFSGRDPDLIVLEELRKTFMHDFQMFATPKRGIESRSISLPGYHNFINSTSTSIYFDINKNSVNHGDVLAKVTHTLYHISRILIVKLMRSTQITPQVLIGANCYICLGFHTTGV